MNGIAFLKIVKGVQKVPGDTLSAEQGLDEIDLLDPNGFSCDDYDMKIPALKSSAVYADSPLSDGRTLISGALGNVIETIRLQLTAGTIIQLAAMLSKLLRFKQDCNDFWDTFGQIEPVYLKHQVIGEPGPRYALLYDIDIDPGQQPLIPSEAKRTVTLSIEREPYWRGLAPGDNPKKWSCFVNGTELSATNASLQGGSGDLVAETASNRQEFNGIHTFLTKNFIDIPAAKLPGDAPPLVCLVVQPIRVDTSTTVANLLIAKSSKPTTMPDRNSSNSLPRYNSLAGAAGVLGTDATFVTDATLGIAHNPVSANRRYVSVSFATATLQLREYWVASSTFSHVNQNLLRGRYQLFLRGEQNGGALGNTTVLVKMLDSGSVFFTSQTISPKLTVANRVQVNDLGVFTLPSGGTSFPGMPGTGLSVSSQYIVAGAIKNYISIELYAARSTGVATLRIYDLVFVPIDEGAVYILPNDYPSITAPGIGCMVYDNTGYFSHGRPDVYTNARLMDGSGGEDNEVSSEARGAFELTSGLNNRLYLLADTDSNVSEGALTNLNFSVYVNIVPRWSGLRDV